MNILVAGAGGFIAGHLVKSLALQGYDVTAVDIKSKDKWFQVHDLKNVETLPKSDLRDKRVVKSLLKKKKYTRIYNLACNMGGMGFIQNNHIDCLESVYIQTNFITAMREQKCSASIFYSSSACAYPQDIQQDVNATAIKESDAYPANPEDGYGWEKLFSEIITQYGARNESIDVRIARFHNCYGPFGTWQGGREKAPAALCRKIIEAQKNKTKEIEIWGDGEQTRSFMYIDDCLEGISRIWESDYNDPVNLGSSELVTINQMVDMIEQIAGTQLERKYLLDKPQGVRGRNSDNTLIKKITGGWEPSVKLFHGLEKTYSWIFDQMSQ
jgi:GDP-D-mannose 3', 5'-epimerase